jgi:quercetin dioxygenase-like cupin family protein
MGTMRDWEKGSAPVEGYIVPPAEGLENPYFPSARGLAWTASTGGLIGVEEGVLEPGQPGPFRHYHTNLTELFYVLEGDLQLQIGEQVVRAGRGTFAFCPIGCVHAFRSAGAEAARVLIMGIPPSIGEGYFRELAKLPPDAGEEAWQQLGQKWGTVVVGPPLEVE